MGANRRYIEEEIPHISSLMCDSAEALLTHAEVVVIGNDGPEAAQVRADIGAQHVVIDLARREVRRPQA
jgi:GDP-mannose 6-dehydrogenase